MFVLNNMFLCLDCGELFDNPVELVETHGLDSPPYEKHLACPSCGGGFVITRKCSICGNYVRGEYVMLKDRNSVCDECYVVHDIRDDIF